MQTFTVVGYYTPNVKHFGEIMIKDKEPYCKKHGYGLVVYDECIRRPEGAMPHWCKFEALLEAMDGNTRTGYSIGDLKSDWVVWMDTDTIIMNDEMKLEDLLQDVMREYGGDPEKKHLIISYVGPEITAGFSPDMWMNSGVFFVRNSEEGREILRHASKQLQWKSHLLSDQMALSESCKKWPERVIRVRRSLFNAILFDYMPGASYSKGNLLVHLNGVPKDKAMEMMRRGRERVLEVVRESNKEVIFAAVSALLLVGSGYKTGLFCLEFLGIVFLLFVSLKNYFPTFA